MKILNVVGARPNFIKMAPILAEMDRFPQITWKLLHTGQHYDVNMNKVFFEQLRIPRPHFNLEVGSGSNPRQVGEILSRTEAIVDQERPDALLVVGDVNSTIGCALVAAYKGIAVIHVEAGLRSFDRSMPEEINRILTDRIADFLFITESSAEKNLLHEGVDPEKIHFVGNVMVDTLEKFRTHAEAESRILEDLELDARQYAFMTLHRPGNVDDPDVLKGILEAVSEIAESLPVVFAMHPRTEKRIREFSLAGHLAKVRTLPPKPYFDSLKLMANAKLVLTDSGGMQEETTVLGVPCLTLRMNTERPVTLSEGTSTLVGPDKKKILSEANRVLENGIPNHSRPQLWDGFASRRIVETLISSGNALRRPHAKSSGGLHAGMAVRAEKEIASA